MNNRNTFLNGITDFLILSILEKKDCYGYEIRNILKEYSGELLDISLTTIYSAIYKMENKNFISEYSTLVGKKRTRIYYHLDPAGIDYLNDSRGNYHKTLLGVQKLFNSLNSIKKEADHE